eukprot:jgi/Chlat1/5537/Chrsp369S05348
MATVTAPGGLCGAAAVSTRSPPRPTASTTTTLTPPTLAQTATSSAPQVASSPSSRCTFAPHFSPWLHQQQQQHALAAAHPPPPRFPVPPMPALSLPRRPPRATSKPAMQQWSPVHQIAAMAEAAGDKQAAAAVGSADSQEEPRTMLFTHTVRADIAAPMEHLWRLWADLPRIPQWMRWIDRVEVLDSSDPVAVRYNQNVSNGTAEQTNNSCGTATPSTSSSSTDSASSALAPHTLSRWVCSSKGFEVMWVARIETVEAGGGQRVLRWSTVDGLRNNGSVRFQDLSGGRHTSVELSISHTLPWRLAQAMGGDALSSLVQATLKSDLARFEEYAVAALQPHRPAATPSLDTSAQSSDTASASPN